MNDEQYARTGRAMLLIAWIIFFVGMFLFFYYYENSESKVYLSSTSELAISAGRDGHYRIKGSINEYPVEFLVDTGASLVALPEKLAEKLNISGRYPVTIETANGEVTGSLTRLDKLSFGEFKLEDVKAVIIPGAEDDTILLGMNVLSRFHIVQQDKKLIIKK